MKPTTRRTCVACLFATLAILIVVIYTCVDLNRSRRAELHRLVADFEEAVAEIRRIQMLHPDNAYDYLQSSFEEDCNPLVRLHLATGVLARQSKALGLDDAAPMLSKVAHGTGRDGTLERIVRLHALFALAEIQPEHASDLVPWVTEVLRESVDEMYRVIDREPPEKMITAFRGRDFAAKAALGVLGALESRACAAQPVLEEIVAGPELWTSPPADYDLRYMAQRVLNRIRKPG